MKQVVQGSARLDSAYRVLFAMVRTPADLQELAGKCLILCTQHTPTHTHTHTPQLYHVLFPHTEPQPEYLNRFLF